MPHIPLTNDIMRIHLSSWRYIAALTLPPLALIYYFIDSYTIIIISLLFLTTHFYCWRLWLDSQLLPLLSHENNIAVFDEAMTMLWPKIFHAGRTQLQRFHGMQQLFKRAVLSLILLWITSLSLLLIHK